MELTPDQLIILSTDYYRYAYSQAIINIFERLPFRIKTKTLTALNRLFITQASFRTEGDLILPFTNSPYYKLFLQELSEIKPKLYNASKYTKQIETFLNGFSQGISTFPRIKSFSISEKGLIIDNKLIPIDSKLWARVRLLYNGVPTLMNYYLARLFLLYSTIGIQTGYQYALPEKVTKDYDLELFASPFNFTLPNYCSLFPEVDQFFRSKGKYPECLDTDYQRITANPPFINIFQNDLARRVILKLNQAEQKGIYKKYLISMANWTDTEAYQLLSKSKYLTKTFSVSTYIDKATGKEIPLPSSISFQLETSPMVSQVKLIVPKPISNLVPPKPIPKLTHHIYFRHSHRINLNLDPPIKPSSLEEAKTVGRKISSLYGIPNSIVSSPYLRTRQTAQIFSQLFNPPPKIWVDPRLSEKLNIRKRTGLGPPGNLDPTTAIYQGLPKLGETNSELKTRISEHLASYSSISEETWFVAHGYVLEALVEMYGAKVPFPPPSLSALVIPRINYNQMGFWFRLYYPKATYTYQRQTGGIFRRIKS